MVQAQINNKQATVHVVGAGLAGTECALQLAEQGISVALYEMRPTMLTPAHKTGMAAELVCSNSLGSLQKPAAPALLKSEMEALGSYVLRAAKNSAVPAGQSLSVDREEFAKELDQKLSEHPLIKRHDRVIRSLSELPRPLVIATGPLTHPDLAQDLQSHFGNDFLYFYDALAPIVDADSINMDVCFKASRYDKGGDDYINCPLTKEQYFALVEAINSAEKVEPKSFEKTQYFEACLPVEVIVSRGPLTLAFGPCKPRGLKDPRTGKEPFAVVQLRQENRFATAFNLVGFQTKMTYPEQKRVFRMIPGLENAEFLKLGSIHRNMFINSPKLLSPYLSSLKDSDLFFAGQMTGVEGYFESTSTGMLVAKFLGARIRGKDPLLPPRESALGSLLGAITDSRDHFQPTNINWGLFPPPSDRIKKDLKKDFYWDRAQSAFADWKNKISCV